MPSSVLDKAKKLFDEQLEEDFQVVMERWRKVMPTEEKGGPGSGFHGHAGRPGHVGGSSAGSGTGNALDYVDTLSSEQTFAIERYTDDGYIHINSALRNAEGYDVGNKNIQSMIHELDTVIANAPPLDHDTVYRMMRGHPDDYGIDLWVIGDYAFGSVTYSESALDRIMTNMDNPPDTFTILKISTKSVKGVSGIGAYIEKASTQPDEKEILLRREMEYEVTDMYKEGNKWYITAEMLP